MQKGGRAARVRPSAPRSGRCAGLPPAASILLSVDSGGTQEPRTGPAGRLRRPSDVARLVAVLLGLLVLAPAVLATHPVDAATDLLPEQFATVPRTLLSIANGVASLAVLAVLVTVAVDALRTRRAAFVAAAVACGLGLGLAVAALRVGAALNDGSTGTPLGPLDDSALPPVAAAVAFLVGADLQRGRRYTEPATVSLVVAIGCALALDSVTVAGVLTAVLLGTAAGLTVRVVAGVTPARPSDAAVRAVLARAGFDVGPLVPIEQSPGRVRHAGRDGSGPVHVLVVDRDRRGVPLARRLWRRVRFRAPAVGRPALSLRGRLEQEALSSGLARSAGVAVPAIEALLPVGSALVLVERPVAGTPLSASSATDLTAAFRAVRRLHDAGLAHGSLDADAVLVLPDGEAGFASLRTAQPAATDLQRELDAVALLVAGARQHGAVAAAAALRSGYRADPGAERRLAALLQPLALPWPVRRALRGSSVLDDLRTELAGAPGSGAVAAPRLERLSLRMVFGVAGGTVAALILATQLSEVDLGSALSQARPGWLAVAVLGSAVTYVGSALVLQAFGPVPLPLVRTSLVQLASSFVTLVTPPTVGHIGLNTRYLQRSGVPVAVAAASVGVGQLVTVVVTVLLLLVCAWVSGVSASRPALLPSGEVLAVLLGAVAVLGLLAAVPPVRRAVRRRIEPVVRRGLPTLTAMTADPRRVGRAVVGTLVLTGGYVVALDASLRAFSAPTALSTLVVVYLVASTVGSTAPTPGGLGAVEAALVGGLTATGVPVAEALTGVLAFRTATFWLPAPIGWVAFVALQRAQRI